MNAIKQLTAAIATAAMCLTVTATVSAQAIARSIVPNGGFEMLTKCPDELGQIERAKGWCYNFGVSPDLYATCAKNKDVSVPCNTDFCQNPSEGNNYAGIIVFSTQKIPKYENGYYYSEDFWIKLKSPLSKGTRYELLMDLRVTDSVFCEAIGYLIARFSAKPPKDFNWPIWYGKKGFMLKVPVTNVTAEGAWMQVSIEFEAERDAEYFQFGLIRPFFTKKEYERTAAFYAKNKKPNMIYILVDEIKLFEIVKIKNIFNKY